MTSRIFWINLPAATVPLAVLFVILHLQEEKQSFKEQMKLMDWLGIVLITTALVGILYATFSGGAVFPWSSPTIVGSMTLGVVSFIAFIFHEAFVAGVYLRAEPLIPLRLFGTRTAWIGYLMVVMQSIVWCSIAFCYPIYVCSTQVYAKTLTDSKL